MAFEKHHYEPIEASKVETNRATRFKHIIVFLGILMVLFSGVLGFVLGMKLSSKTPFEIDFPKLSLTFESNATFRQLPADLSAPIEDIWGELYPHDLGVLKNGVFDYPDKDPKRMVFSGVHQMHCVESLYRGYFEGHDARLAVAKGADISAFPTMITPDHVLHCVEYLRQSLFCHADVTMEDESLGFGVVHECRDWWSMIAWVNERNERRAATY